MGTTFKIAANRLEYSGMMDQFSVRKADNVHLPLDPTANFILPPGKTADTLKVDDIIQVILSNNTPAAILNELGKDEMKKPAIHPVDHKILRVRPELATGFALKNLQLSVKQVDDFIKTHSVTKENFDEKVITESNKNPVLIEFSSGAGMDGLFPPCETVKAIFTKISNEASGKLVLSVIDTYVNYDPKGIHGIDTEQAHLPLLVLFNHGREIARLDSDSAQKKYHSGWTKEIVTQWLNENGVRVSSLQQDDAVKLAETLKDNTPETKNEHHMAAMQQVQAAQDISTGLPIGASKQVTPGTPARNA